MLVTPASGDAVVAEFDRPDMIAHVQPAPGDIVQSVVPDVEQPIIFSEDARDATLISAGAHAVPL